MPIAIQQISDGMETLLFFVAHFSLSPLIMHIDDIESVTAANNGSAYTPSECKAFTVKCIKIHLLVDTKGESIIQAGVTSSMSEKFGADFAR